MDRFSTNKLPDEYAALGDPVQVMAEVLTLIEQVRVSNKKLGDAFVSAGLAGREWRGRDCELALLSDQLPDVTLDALLTRLAEFASGTGPHRLHGGIADIEQFNDEASILSETLRALRIVAQRQRMLPLRQRGSLPMQRALGDARVGTQLDRLAAALRDLESLAPYIVPPEPGAWTRPPLAPVPEESAPPAVLGVAQAPISPARSQLTPQVARATPARTDPFGQKTLGIRQRNMSRRLTAAMASMATQARVVGERLEPRKWLVVGVTAVVLAASTAFVGLLVHNGGTGTSIPASQLTATPPRLSLSCTGRGATASLTLRDAGGASLTWSTKPSSALILSATQGTLKQGASAPLTVKAHTNRSTQGTLTFTSALGNATVAYTITCR